MFLKTELCQKVLRNVFSKEPLSLFQMFQRFLVQPQSLFLRWAQTIYVWAGAHSSPVGFGGTRWSMLSFLLERSKRLSSVVTRTPPCWLGFNQIRSTWSRSVHCTSLDRRERCRSKPALRRVRRSPQEVHLSSIFLIMCTNELDRWKPDVLPCHNPLFFISLLGRRRHVLKSLFDIN